MSDSIVKAKAKELAKHIIFLCRELKSNHKESVLINQLLRSGTSIGANLHETQSFKVRDFSKECLETEYWLELLPGSDCITDEQYKPLQNSCGQIRRMLISTVTTINQKNKNEANTLLLRLQKRKKCKMYNQKSS